MNGKTHQVSKKRLFIVLIKRTFVVALAFFMALLLGLYGCVSDMPGRSYRGELAPLTAEEVVFRDELHQHVEKLSMQIGVRNTNNMDNLRQSADYIADEMQQAGLRVTRQTYEANGEMCDNVIGELPGKGASQEILVIGAHYDTVYHCPGANDNGSGVAALLAIAGKMGSGEFRRTIRFVGFVNEEWPFFQSSLMGSQVYARACYENGDNIVGMISLETIGYYSDEPQSQRYPFPFSVFYPSKGNFIGFVGNWDSRSFVRETVGFFRENCDFPSEGAAVPDAVKDAGRSDHRSFWEVGYQALMITDTAPFRYPYYHTRKDTIDKLDFDRLARVTAGLEKVIAELAKIR